MGDSLEKGDRQMPEGLDVLEGMEDRKEEDYGGETSKCLTVWI